jgi:glycosyltransferase involved in cell wall biosynthesis
MFRKKSIVIVGGYEVARVPEIGYGAMLNPIYAQAVRFVLNHSDRVFAVSEFNKKEIAKYTRNKNVRVVYGSNMIDCHSFSPSGEKGNLVLTVGFVGRRTVKRKGFEAFISAAGHLPHVRFVLVGNCLDNSIESLKSGAPSNVAFMDDRALVRWYQEAKVYCQLSYYESFGVALAEAMACQCVPVVTHKGALPEVVGDSGFYVPYGDPVATAEAIKMALASDKGKAASERIQRMFASDKLERELIAEIEELLGT